jgi:protocatechuate 3,4-dioxygenase, alpha subunit
MSLPRTPSQTVGPYYAIGLTRAEQNVLDPDGIELNGTLYDGRGTPIPDGMIEVWDAAGKRWGRCGTKERNGGFLFRVPRDADCLEVFVFARGMLRHERTRIYLRETEDEVLAGLEPARRARLTASAEGDGLRFDIRMQGEGASVFFEH